MAPSRTRQADLLEAALEYAGRGLPVFPCKGKRPYTEHGFQDATTDTATVLAWWQRWREANIGITTGAVSGLVVLDVDVQHGGQGTLAERERADGKLPTAPEVVTGGGGKHIYFAHPGGELRNSAGQLGPGLDVRGTAATSSRRPPCTRTGERTSGSVSWGSRLPRPLGCSRTPRNAGTDPQAPSKTPSRREGAGKSCSPSQAHSDAAGSSVRKSSPRSPP